MKILATGTQMKICDQNMQKYYAIPSIVLMERAAFSFVQELKQHAICCSKVLIFCGNGNNGGDGYAVGRMLYQEAYQVEIVTVGDGSKMTKECATQFEICKRYGIPIISLEQARLSTPDLVIDALLGTSLNREVKDEYKKAILLMNQFKALKWAVDIPSGVESATGQVLGCAFEANNTVTFAYGKVGLYVGEGAKKAGQVIVTKIGIGKESWLDQKPTIFSMESDDLERLPSRDEYGNKGTFGKVLIIAGSKEMSGAAFLSAKAAYKSGCGLVVIYTHQSNRTILATQLPEAIIHVYNNYQEEQLAKEIQNCNAIVLGPGIGLEEEAKNMVRFVLRRSEVPLIIDGDAITIISQNMSWIRSSLCPCVFTPHPKEMSRLCGESVHTVKEHAIELAQSFTKEYNVFCILKDARTIISLTNGNTYINTTGNCGMATGGSGDVLTGILGALLCSLAPIEESLALGVMVHGLAGDTAAKVNGKYGVVASAIIECLSQVWPRR